MGELAGMKVQTGRDMGERDAWEPTVYHIGVGEVKLVEMRTVD